LLLCGLLAQLPPAAAQVDPWADAVTSVVYGPGAGFGQDYFPDNVLGPPDSSATPLTPASDPAEILALGSGGVIVLEFQDGGIADDPGPDFTVFENPFWIGGDSTAPFCETGFVAVSQDGESWQEFPWDPVTLAGLAGVTPTNGGAPPTDPELSGGDAFDLAELGLTHARFVRITDTAGQVPDGGDSFDLDAVVAVHGENGDENVRRRPITPGFTATLFPNPCNGGTVLRLVLTQPGPVSVVIHDLLGRRITSPLLRELTTGEHHLPLDLAVPAGLYFVRIETGAGNRTLRALHLP